MLIDSCGQPTNLESTARLLYPPAKNQQAWDKFHLDYVSQVGPIVGFKRPSNAQRLTKPERKVFECIFAEYYSQREVQKLFGSYEIFFHRFFVNSYGFGYQEGRYVDKKKSLEQKLNEKIGEQERNETKEAIKDLEFTKNINLPLLLYYCLESKGKKQKHHFRRDFNLAYQEDDERVIETRLRPEFSSDPWEHLFSNNDDCINITLGKGDIAGEENKEFFVKFQKYWYASLLHYLHPKIQYLDFKTPSRDVPRPLVRVKLMEAQDASGIRYLIVGGVLGTDFRKIKTRGIEEYIDSCIREFFLTNYSKKDRLLYNLNHMPDETKPYNQFIEFIRKKYSLDENKLKVIKEVNGKKCTHSVKVPWEDELITKISNVDLDGDDKYHGEQYSETYEPNRVKGGVGSFVELKDGLSGFDVSIGRIKRSKWRAYAAIGLLGSLLAGGVSYSLFKEKPVLCDSAELTGLRMDCNSKDGIKSFDLEDLTNITSNANRLIFRQNNVLYKAEFNNAQEKEEFVKAYNSIGSIREIVSKVRSDPERAALCSAERGSFDSYSEFMLYLAGCVAEEKALARTLDLIAKYQNAGLAPTADFLIKEIAIRAYKKRSSGEVLALVHSFWEEKVFNLLKKSEETQQNTETIVKVLSVFQESGNEMLFTSALGLAEHYTSKGGFKGGLVEMNERYGSIDPDFGDGYLVFSSLNQAIRVVYPDAMAKFLALADRLKEHPKAPEIVEDLTNIIVDALSRHTEPRGDIYNRVFFLVIDAVDRYALVDKMDESTYYNRVGVLVNAMRYISDSAINRGNKFSEVLVFSNLIFQDCVYEKLIRLTEPEQFKHYLLRIVDVANSPDSLLKLNQSPYELGLCEQKK